MSRSDARTHAGCVVAAFGRNFLVESDHGDIVHCLVRGKGASLACGDRVLVSRTAHGSVIEAVEPRSTLFARASGQRTKLLAANATQVAIVTAVEPSFSDELVLRVSVTAAAAGMRSFIVLNKIDLAEAAAAARARLEPFVRGGWQVVELSARQDPAPLLPLLEGETTVLVGQSGMGKSTLVNALVPDANAATAAISKFLESGRHTTTASRLYRLQQPATAIIDTPGMQEFGVAHLERREIDAAVRAFAPYLGRCRFPDCRHAHEPGCAVRDAVSQGAIPGRLLELYLRVVEDVVA